MLMFANEGSQSIYDIMIKVWSQNTYNAEAYRHRVSSQVLDRAYMPSQISKSCLTLTIYLELTKQCHTFEVLSVETTAARSDFDTAKFLTPRTEVPSVSFTSF